MGIAWLNWKPILPKAILSRALAYRKLLVGDYLAEVGDVFFDRGNLLGPGAFDVIRVRDAGGVLALGFGEAFVQVSEFLFESGAGHRGRLPCC